MAAEDGDADRMIADWRASIERVSWLKEMVAHPFGRELASIVREYSPETQVGDRAISAETTLLLGQLLKASEGSTLGMIAGHNRLRNLIFKRLTSHASSGVARQRKPGESNPVDPHQGTPPST
jgi:L-aminopeptidase/D-esterase-like protein